MLRTGGSYMEQMTAVTGQEKAGIDRSLDATVKKFNEVFNRPTAKEFASFWADEGTLLNPFGNYGRGPSGAERIFHEDTQKFFEGTTSSLTIVGARKIADDCVLLDLESEVQNARLPDGSRGPMSMHIVILAQRKGEAWKWLDVRPYVFRERPQPLH